MHTKSCLVFFCHLFWWAWGFWVWHFRAHMMALIIVSPHAEHLLSVECSQQEASNCSRSSYYLKLVFLCVCVFFVTFMSFAQGERKVKRFTSEHKVKRHKDKLVSTLYISALPNFPPLLIWREANSRHQLVLLCDWTGWRLYLQKLGIIILLLNRNSRLKITVFFSPFVIVTTAVTQRSRSSAFSPSCVGAAGYHARRPGTAPCSRVPWWYLAARWVRTCDLPIMGPPP